eukprot:m.10828 g.10828  ORF g.10828 m.10828 type:complete len:68 (-) comp8504_c0_seq1:932-1135(-)
MHIYISDTIELSFCLVDWATTLTNSGKLERNDHVSTSDDNINIDICHKVKISFKQNDCSIFPFTIEW